MSPELLDPDQFGFENSQPTKESDFYAFGMVILEVLSGQAPFPRCNGSVVLRKVIGGERPGKPQGAEGAWFTDDLWEVLERCWSPQPKNRPTVDATLECLKRGSPTWQPPHRSTHSDVEIDTDDESCSTANSPGMFPHSTSDPGLTSKGKASGSRKPPPQLLVVPSPPSRFIPSQKLEKPDPVGSAGIVNRVSLVDPLDAL